MEAWGRNATKLSRWPTYQVIPITATTRSPAISRVGSSSNLFWGLRASAGVLFADKGRGWGGKQVSIESKYKGKDKKQGRGLALPCFR